jgi:CheY-like chemotaxis protein
MAGYGEVATARHGLDDIDDHDPPRFAARLAEMEEERPSGETPIPVVLAAGLVHELNNPLTYLTLNLGLVSRELKALSQLEDASLGALNDTTAGRTTPGARAALDRAREALRLATEGAEQLATIVRELRLFARSGTATALSEGFEDQAEGADLEPPPPTEERVSSGPSSSRRRIEPPRVLVVDEEQGVRSSLDEVCHTLDPEARVVVATSGGEAISEVQRDQSFDLILCGLTLGDMGGLDLHEALRRARPGVERRVVFVRKQPPSHRVSEALRTLPNHTLPFPVDAPSLRETIDDMRFLF